MIDIPKISKPAGEDKAPRWFHIAVAMSMLLSAGAGLVSALKTSATMQALVDQNARLVKAGSTPILQFYKGNITPEGVPSLRLWVENVGTGPARVVWLDVKFQDKPVNDVSLLPELAASAAGLKAQAPGSLPYVRSTITGHVIKAGNERRIFEAKWRDLTQPAHKQVYEALDQQFTQIQAEACYCSVFEECWQTDFGPALPKVVANCERPSR